MRRQALRLLGLRAASFFFHAVCNRDYSDRYAADHGNFQSGLASTEEFFRRFRGTVTIENKDVLDFGCGMGSTCVYVAQQGARSVVGIDKQATGIALATRMIADEYPHLSSQIRFAVSSDVSSAPADSFDIVISKDSAEHYDNPESAIAAMATMLSPGGSLVIGFGPLWKAPFGGHIRFMTGLPWAHLIFPEHVIMNERRRYYPDQYGKRLADVPDGLNKMTLSRFEAIMAATALECTYFRTNVSTLNPRIMRISSLLARIPGCREYFTWNVYGVWSR